MIPEKSTAVIDSTVSGEAISMGMDEAAMGHIMSILTNIYSDPELAIIREYSTNGLDSHIAAGQSRPVEVETPTPLRPLLIIRDFGLGLSADDIRSIYSRYGASTKRGTNDAVGMLGIGCKSALAYTDQFTLTGTKDGRRMTVSIARDEAGGGTMTVLADESTDAPDGVEVTIPAKRDNMLDVKAAQFFACWEPGTVLLNGEAPKPLDGWHVSDEFIIRDVDGSNNYSTYADNARFRVIMGNVSYPAPEGFTSDVIKALPRQKELVARVPIGTVSFAPSREALMDHPSTRAALDQVLAGFKDACAAYVKAQVEGAPTKPAAAKALVEARDALGEANVETPQWRGKDVPGWVEVPAMIDPQNGEKKEHHTLWHAYSSYKSSSYRNQLSKVRFDQAVNFTWVLGFDNETWSSSMSRKLDKYLVAEEIEEGNIARDILIYTGDEVPGADWIDGAAVTVKWSDVRAWKDPNVAAAAGAGGVKYAGTYCAILPDGTRKEKHAASDIDTEKPLHFTANGKWDHRAHLMQKILGGTIVMMPDTRLKKFLRLFPTAKPAASAAEAATKEWLAGLPALKREAIEIGPHLGQHGRLLKSLDAGEINDNELSRLVEIATVWDKELEATFRERQQFMYSISEAGSKRIRKVLGRYPLLTSAIRGYGGYDSLMLDHLTTYVNAVN